MRETEDRYACRYAPPIPGSVVVGFDRGQWTALTIAALRHLWLEGYSSKRIGEYLGFTKNSIVGKAHRLDLPPRETPIIRDPSRTQAAHIQRIQGETLPRLQSEPDRSWITEERKEILRNLWPSVTPTSRIHELLVASPGAPLPSPQNISTYANTHLKLRRPQRPTPVRDPNAPALVRGPMPAMQPRVAVASGHGQQRQGQILAAMAHRAVTPVVPVTTPKAKPYGRVIECSWPLNDGRPWKFCDADTLPGKSYCKLHQDAAYGKFHARTAAVVPVGDAA